MSAKRDYYEVLGVARDADASQIKRAYRKAAMKYHPDRNPGDNEAEERFKEAAEAFEVLNDAEKRQLYDRFGHEGPSRAGFSGFSGSEEIFSHFGDLFGDLFGNLGFSGRGRGGPARGADIKVQLEITLADVVQGANRDVVVPRRESCETCGGSGAKPGTSAESCRHCGGRGQVVHRQGFFTLQTTCPVCRGEGRMITDPCRDCGGTGMVQRETTLTVNVPPGVDDGQTLRIQGRGQAGPQGGPPGNLYVVLRLKPDPRFVRDEYDIHSKVEVSMFQAALGCTVEVDTLEGTDEVEIKPGTQAGEVLIRRNQGIPVLGERGRGDHHVHVEVTIPEDLTKEEAEQLRQMAEARGEHVAPARTGLFSGFRKRRRG
ncbi:MAG: molecular chaperone DnaJ [Myxococcales bacterium]|nr:molecular chaperone DnaJ [Myxococcales bacterium]